MNLEQNKKLALKEMLALWKAMAITGYGSKQKASWWAYKKGMTSEEASEFSCPFCRRLQCDQCVPTFSNYNHCSEIPVYSQWTRHHITTPRTHAQRNLNKKLSSAVYNYLKSIKL